MEKVLLCTAPLRHVLFKRCGGQVRINPVAWHAPKHIHKPPAITRFVTEPSGVSASQYSAELRRRTWSRQAFHVKGIDLVASLSTACRGKASEHGRGVGG